jgi:hypothetical protein
MLWDRVEKFNAPSHESHNAHINASEFPSLTVSRQRSPSIRTILFVVGFPPFPVIPPQFENRSRTIANARKPRLPTDAIREGTSDFMSRSPSGLDGLLNEMTIRTSDAIQPPSLACVLLSAIALSGVALTR